MFEPGAVDVFSVKTTSQVENTFQQTPQYLPLTPTPRELVIVRQQQPSTLPIVPIVAIVGILSFFGFLAFLAYMRRS